MNNQYIETKIVFQNVNINKIAFDDYFLKINVTKILLFSTKTGRLICQAKIICIYISYSYFRTTLLKFLCTGFGTSD